MAAVTYHIQAFDPDAHYFSVCCRITAPDPDGQQLYLPDWIPGSYLIRDFSRHIVDLRAETAAGDAVALEKQGKSSWRAAAVSGELLLHYRVYAWDTSVRTAYLDRQRGFFNGTSLCLRVAGQESSPHEIELLPPPSTVNGEWRVATTMPRSSDNNDDWGFGRFVAQDYDELVDHPFELGAFEVVEFTAASTAHAVVLSGVYELDKARLAADLTAICAAHVARFPEPKPPFNRYLFLTNVVGDGYGGLEHRSSTALLCSRSDLPQPGMREPSAAYRNFLGLCSHEYFHSWHVKRIKPAAFTPFNYQQEAYTTLLWAFEGITSYLDDYTVLQTGHISVAHYLEQLGKTITRVQRGAGRLVQSLADSSFDAWHKFYKQDENSSNAIVSYYAKGALVALLLDLSLRLHTDGRCNLDHVMCELWQRYGQTGVGVPERGVEAVVAEVSGLDLDDFFQRYLHGTDELAFAELFSAFGLKLNWRSRQNQEDVGGTASQPGKPQWQAEFGASWSETPAGLQIKNVQVDGAAKMAGIAAGDCIVAINGLRATATLLNQYLLSSTAEQRLQLHAFRRDELQLLSLQLLPAEQNTAWLSLDDAADAAAQARREAWLGSDQSDPALSWGAKN